MSSNGYCPLSTGYTQNNPDVSNHQGSDDDSSLTFYSSPGDLDPNCVLTCARALEATVNFAAFALCYKLGLFYAPLCAGAAIFANNQWLAGTYESVATVIGEAVNSIPTDYDGEGAAL